MSTSLSLYDFINNVLIGFLLIIVCFPIGYAFSDFPSFVLIAMSYIIGLIYSKLNELSIGKLLRNCPALMRVALLEVEKEFLKRDFMTERKMYFNYSNCEGNYYKVYYKGWKGYCVKNVEILEAQLAFIRNLWPITIIYFISILTQDLVFFYKVTGYSYFTLMPIIIIMIFFLMVILHKSIGRSFVQKKCCVICSIFYILLFICSFLCRLLCSSTPICLLPHCIMNVSTCELLFLCALLIIVLPIVGYHIQKKIYKLVFEYDKYIS